ncbi:MAG: bacillithiol system redox-active protein YtxJ [Candidatus Longimicrobiales bacterium M2_2A_002]
MNEPTPKPIRQKGELDTVLDQPVAVLYKHSPLCGASAAAVREVRAFMSSHTDVPVYLVDVIRDRPLAREVARRLSIRHESPQAFVLRDGRVVWSGSHHSVTTEALSEQLDGAHGNGAG